MRTVVFFQEEQGFVHLGSHKANIPPHEGFGMLELDDEAVYHPTVSAGDMILFVRSTLSRLYSAARVVQPLLLTADDPRCAERSN